MVYINEFLPNPIGSDASGELIELYNRGNTTVALDGWRLATNESGKTKPFLLSGYTIAAHGYLVLKKTQTRISLKNTDGALFLYGSDGALVDHASFVGDAPEGKSFSRISYDGGPEQHFVFEDPTPGMHNGSFDLTVTENDYPIGVTIAPQIAPSSLLLLLVGTALTIIVLFSIIFANHENLSQLIFTRDSTPR